MRTLRSGSPLVVPAELVAATRRRSRRSRVVRADIAGSPAVAVFQGRMLRLVLTADDARAIADTMHDLLDETEGESHD